MKFIINNTKIYKLYMEACKEMSTNPDNAVNKLKKILQYIKKNINRNNKISNEPKRLYSNVVIGIGNAYHFMKRDAAAVAFYKDALTNNFNKYLNSWGRSGSLNNMVNYTNNITDNKKIKLYIKSCKMDQNNLSPHVNLRNIYHSKIKQSNDQFSLKYLRQEININNIHIIFDKSNKPNYDINIIRLSIKIIKGFKDIRAQEKWLALNVNSDINPLFYNLKTHENNFDNFDTRESIVNLFELVECSLQFLNSHLISKSPDKLLYQYTGLNTLRSICSIDDNTKKDPIFQLRLYNSDYMNDPLEGKELLKQLMNNKHNSNVKNVINYIYHNDLLGRNKSKKLTPLHASTVYIASLSYVNPGDNNSMSLWNSYSDNHRGISLGLKINIHRNNDNYDMDDSSNNSLSNMDKDANNINTIPLNLYRVSYGIEDFNNPHILSNLEFERKFYRDQENNNEVKHHKYFRNKMHKKYRNITARIKDIKYLNILTNILNDIHLNVLKNNNHVFNLIKLSLDRIRFLSKSGVYQYEQEYRIMEEIPSDTDINTLYDNGNEKLYVNLHMSNNITARLKEIVFGNLCKSYYWVPVVRKQLPGVKTLKSNIKYR